jgi:hypothetical protein
VLRTDLGRIVGILVACSLVSPLYAIDEFPDYAVRQADTYAVTTQKANLVIGVQPIEDLKEQRTYFHTELAPKGFLPVFVVIQNGSSADSFLFDKAKLTYGPFGAGVSTPKSGSKAGESLALSAIPFVGLVAALKVISSASQVQQNILKKELKSTTLSPGASAHGFLYIPVPKDGHRQKINLRVSITRADADEATVLDLIF